MVGKSNDVKHQLKIWSKLLEGRMALQRVVVATRELSHDEKVDEETDKSLSKLMKTLVILRDTCRQKGQFCLENDQNAYKYNDDEADDDDGGGNGNQQEINDDFLDERHTAYTGLRNDVIEKWCDKTKIGTIPKKGYAAMELPTLKLIENSLKDKERLIRRTQLDRTSNQDDSYHPETFNDDDFYHQLLKEMISKNESSRWVELQRLRYKQKRKADTRATKGRKIKKDLIPKLVNFMAPHRPVHLRSRESTMPDQIRTELMRSLFGGGVSSSSSFQHQHRNKEMTAAEVAKT